MTDARPSVDQRIAQRVRDLRSAHGLSLESLANKCGVSRSMISLVERGESSPTAAVLEKLAGGLEVTLASLFEDPNVKLDGPSGPVARREEQAKWQDPASGYVRCNISPAGVRQPIQIVEVHFPPARSVAFEASVREMRVYQQVWVLEGAIDITAGKERHRLRQGDCLAMELDAPMMFYNPTRKTTRYAVVTFSALSGRS